MDALIRKDSRPTSVCAGEILAFMCVRNESLRLPFCLSYHRQLGVSRFFIIDNNSTDDTLGWLLDQPDVHVWHTTGSFGAARCGTDWVERLLKEYGESHWCLVIDADELLCYRDCETRRVDQLCAELERQRARAFLALLLDMYSDQPLKATHYQRGQSLLDVCPYFDRQYHHLKTDNFFGRDQHMSYFGGLRQRVFGGNEPGRSESYFYCLNKLPLIKYDQSLILSDNFHWTNCRDVALETGCLLHFKYLSSFITLAGEEATRKEHWNGALQYAQYARVLKDHPDLTLFSDQISVRYRDSRQLLELGIIQINRLERPSKWWQIFRA
jgi:hypothetical protein